RNAMTRSYCLLIVFVVAVLIAALSHAQTLEPKPLFVEGYADQLSYAPGDEVGLCVSTTAAKYGVEIARVRAKREVVLTKKDIEGKEHRTPDECSSHGCG